MEKRMLLAASLLLLASCGGGSGSDSNNGGTVVTPPVESNDTQSVIGTWYYQYPNQCIETYKFNGDGSFSIHSGEEESTGTYTFEETVPTGDRHSLTLNIESQNSELDCEGTQDNLVGVSIEAFTTFSNYEQMRIFDNKSGGEVLISLQKSVELSFSGLDATAYSGQEISFIVNKDLFPETPVSLLYGPNGMSVSGDGKVTWKADIPMFARSQVVHFAFTSERVVTPLEGEITINFDNYKAPSRLSQVVVPHQNKKLFIGNFDEISGNELVNVGRSSLSFLSLEGEKAVSEWTYPYNLGKDNSYIKALPFKNGTKSEMYVMSEHTIRHVSDVNSPAQVVYTSEDKLYEFDVKNIDDDPEPELALVLDPELGDQKLIVIDDDFSTVLFSTEQYNIGYSIKLANVDADANFEVVTQNGDVFDIASGELQWNLNIGFGQYFITADVDGDDVDEIVRMTDGEPATVYSALTQSVIATIELENASMCSGLAMNLDEDVAEELVLGNCSNGYIYAFDLDETSYTQKWSIEQQISGAKSLAAGDIDNDGIDEIIWATDSYAEGNDNKIVLVNPGTVPSVTWLSPDESVNGGTPLGFASLMTGQSEAIFSSLSGTIVSLSTYAQDGELDTVAQQDLLQNINATPVLNDNGTDVFFLTNNLKNLRINTINIDSGTAIELASLTTESGNYRKFTTLNLNGQEMLLISDWKYVLLVDLQSQNVVSKLDTHADIKQIIVIDENDSTALLGVLNDLYVTTISVENNTLTEKEKVAGALCDGIVSSPDDSDLICYGDSIRYYDGNLELQNEVKAQARLSHPIAQTGSDNLVATFESKIGEISFITGDIIWESPEFGGSVENLWMTVDGDNHPYTFFSSDGVCLSH